MVIKPKVRSFMCITAHPAGCEAEVQRQIDYVKSKGEIPNSPKRVLVIGSSTGYGLSSRIASAFAGNAATVGVFFEREASNGKTASAGWYNTAAFTKAAEAAGLTTININGDAFSDSIKARTIDHIKQTLGQVDEVIYSLASPRRTDPKTGSVHKATLKPVGEKFNSVTLDTDKKLIQPVEIQPASDEEISDTIKVMGGEDWQLWIERLIAEDALAPGASTVAYSYIGPDVTWPIYRNGTIGRAKEHLEKSASSIEDLLKEKTGGTAKVAVNKAVVTQASSAIPVVPLYISILFRIMKEKDIQEGCIEQIYRLYKDRLFNGGEIPVDEVGRVRVDDWEMREDVQKAVAEIWPNITSDNLLSETDFASYQEEFLRLFGFGIEGVDYDADVDEVVSI